MDNHEPADRSGGVPPAWLAELDDYERPDEFALYLDSEIGEMLAARITGSRLTKHVSALHAHRARIERRRRCPNARG